MKFSVNENRRRVFTVAVIDAQGAGIGRSVISELRKAFGRDLKIYALGTNEAACANMKAAGANSSVCGDDKISRFVETRSIDCMIGPMGVISCGGIKGEISARLSRAVFEAKCRKYIIPLDLHGVYIPGTRSMKISDSIGEIVSDIRKNRD